MKRLMFLIELGTGFILGSKAGPGAYQSLEQKVRAFKDRPEVEETVERTKGAASEQVSGVVDRVNEKLPPPSKRVAV
jgi:hypothetical protein